MSTNVETPSSNFDTLKWVAVVALLLAAVAGNYYFSEVQSIAIWGRIAGVLVTIALAAGVAATTEKGAAFFNFAKESRTEARKVVWPTKQETWQTTLIVFAFCLVMALALWLIDGIMVWLVNLITGASA